MQPSPSRIRRRYISRLSLCTLIFGSLVLTAAPVLGHGGLHERVEGLVAQIELNPDDPELRFELAAVYCQHGEWVNALVGVERTESIAPRKFPTAVVRAESLLGIAQAEEARSALDEFLMSHPEHARAFLLRARALTRLGQFEAAMNDYRRALSLGRPVLEWVREAADAFAARGRGAEALAILNEAIAKLGEIPSLVTRAMELEIAGGRFDEALIRVASLQKSATSPEPWMAKRAALLARVGRMDEARVEWEALKAHLATLPNLERGSHVITQIAKETEQALRSLAAPALSASATAR